MLQVKPSLKRAPAPAVLAKQQELAEKLLTLETWSEAPNKQPPEPAKPKKATTPKAPAEKPAPEPPKKPWQAPSVDAVHPYHVILSERLYQKLDWVWKRKGYKSMRELVLATLDAEADKALKAMGEM